MFQSLKSQRTSLVPILKVTDSVTQVKQYVNETLDISGAAVVPKEHPEAGYSGLGRGGCPRNLQTFSDLTPGAIGARSGWAGPVWY